MYYFVLAVVRGTCTQTFLTGGSVSIIDRHLTLRERLRVVNEHALLLLTQRYLRETGIAGVTIRKVAGVVHPSDIERSVIGTDIILGGKP